MLFGGCATLRTRKLRRDYVGFESCEYLIMKLYLVVGHSVLR